MRVSCAVLEFTFSRRKGRVGIASPCGTRSPTSGTSYLFFSSSLASCRRKETKRPAHNPLTHTRSRPPRRSPPLTSPTVAGPPETVCDDLLVPTGQAARGGVALLRSRPWTCRRFAAFTRRRVEIARARARARVRRDCPRDATTMARAPPCVCRLDRKTT